MPLRVKCRCGQELVLRFNEWVHALFGLLVVSLIINGTALAYIALKLDVPKALVEPSRPAETSEKNAGEQKAGDKEASDKTDGAAPASPEPPLAAAPRSAAPAASPTPDTPAGTEDARKLPASPLAVEKLPAPAPLPPSSPGLKTSAAAPRAPLAPAATDGKSARVAEEKPEAISRAEAVKRPRQGLLAEGTMPIERLLIVEKGTDLRLLIAFLSDGDECVRRAALKKCLAAPPPSGPSPQRDLLLVALPAVPWLLRHGGADLLIRLAGENHGPDPRSWWSWGRGAIGFDEAKDVPGEIWLPLVTRAQVLKESSAAAQAIEKSRRPRDGKAAPGIDVLLALDATESMEEPLLALTRSAWIFSALTWSIPDLRVGLLWYDDEVKGALALGAEPRDLARALSGIKAEGGGDVPEGVHEALKAALQLGRFDWRPEASKHIFFVGDGPPRRAEVPALMSLARECHQDGGYRIHAISVNPTEGRTSTLQFPELAAAGGGLATTVTGDRIAGELFLALFPQEARAELTRLLPLEIPPAP